VPEPSRLENLPILGPDSGYISGVPIFLVPDQGWATVQNARFRRGKAEKVPGWIKAQAGALTGSVVGIYDYIKTNGYQAWIVVTTSRIYKKTPSDATFVDITGAALTGSTVDWADMTNFRDTLIITNGRDAIRKWDGIAATTSNLGGSPPKARRVAAFQNHVMLCDIDPYGVPEPQKVQWSDLGLPESWTAGGSSEAGSFLLNDEPSAVLEIMPLGDSLVAYKDYAIYIIDYTGFPFTMTTRRLATGVGIIGPRVVVNVRDAHYIVSPDNQLYRVTLDGPDPTGLEIRTALFGELNYQYRDRAFGFLNDADNEVYFMIPAGGQTFPNVAYVGAYIENKWGRRTDITATAAAERGVRLLTDILWDDAVGSWDAQLLTWDSTRQSAGSYMVLHGDSGGFVYKHAPGENNADTTAITADIHTKVFDLGYPGRHKRLHRLHVYYDRQDATTLEVYVLASETPTGPQTTSGPFTLLLDGAKQWVDLDITARYFQFRFRNASLNQPFSIGGYMPEFYVRDIA